MDNPDIYIKDKGYVHIMLYESQKAKEWCYKNGYINLLTDFGKEWCGEPVWYPGMVNGGYGFALILSHLKEFVLKAQNAGLIIESEFDMENL